MADIDERVIEALRKENYEIVEPIGLGHTRRVFRGKKKGRIDVAIKIPLREDEMSPDSLTTMINMSKGNLNEREIDVLCDITHDNITRILDFIRVPETGTIVIEQYFNGCSLEKLVEEKGPITSHNQFTYIFSKVIDGVSALHDWGILHRDIKPGNILVSDTQVKVSDLQNANFIDRISESALPTKGGTPYTDPRILNGLITGEKVKADKRSDIYAVAASMYYALTGEHAFDYSLVPDESGFTIANGLKASIRRESGNTGSISSEEHESRLQKMLVKAPLVYRNMLHKAMSAAGEGITLEEMKKNLGMVWNLQDAREVSYCDAMTKLKNREGFYTYASLVDDFVKQEKKNTSIIYYEISKLKRMQDVYGSDACDAAIKETAEFLSNAYGKDKVYRTGASEFCVVMHGEDKKKAEEKTAKVEKDFGEHIKGFVARLEPLEDMMQEFEGELEQFGDYEFGPEVKKLLMADDKIKRNYLFSVKYGKAACLALASGVADYETDLPSYAGLVPLMQLADRDCRSKRNHNGNLIYEKFVVPKYVVPKSKSGRKK